MCSSWMMQWSQLSLLQVQCVKLILQFIQIQILSKEILVHWHRLRLILTILQSLALAMFSVLYGATRGFAQFIV